MNHHQRRFPSPWLTVVVAVVAAGAIASAVVLTRPVHKRISTPLIKVWPGRPEPNLRGPQVWVVAIGIDQYQDAAIPSCRGAVREARAVGRWFTQTARWSAGHVLIMDDLGSPTHGTVDGSVDDLLPIRSNLDWAFREWLPRRSRPEDLIVVYYAGQALALAPGVEDKPAGPGRSFLLPIDAKASRWDESGWRLEDAINDLAATGRNSIICWLDTSLLGRGRRVDAGSTFLPSATSWLQALARWPGVTAWLASDGQSAVEATTVGDHSPFTAALLNALGTPENPRNLHACLTQLNHDEAMTRRGFRALGGFEPSWTLWSSRIERLSLLKREPLLQRGHAAGISALAITADGRRLITGGHDSTIKLWDLTDRTVLRALSYHMVGVTSLALSTSGRRLASGDGSGRLRVWDLVNQREVSAGPPHDRGIDQLAFLPEGERLVSLDLDGTTRLWDAAAPANQSKPLRGDCTALACASRPGPIAFVRAERGGTLRLHRSDGQEFKRIDGPGGIVTSRRLATDGRLVAAGDDLGHLMVWDARSSKLVDQRSFESAVDVLHLSTTGCLAVTTRATVHRIALEEGRIETSPDLAISSPANQVTSSNDGRWLAAGTATGGLHLWRVTPRGNAEPVALEKAAETGSTTMLMFSPDGRMIISGDQDGGIRSWDLPEGNQRPRVPPRRGQVTGLSVSDDGRYLLQITQDHEAQVWDLKDGRDLSRLPGRWTSGALSPDGDRIVLTTQAEGDVVVVDRASGQVLAPRFARPAASNPRFGKVAVSRDGRWVAAGSVEGPLACVWDAWNGKIVQSIRGHLDPNPITAIGFSADALQLLTASEDGTAKLWDLADPARPAHELASFPLVDARTGEPVPVTAAQISPTPPRRVVIGGIDGQVRLWEEGQARPLEMGRLDRAVLALAWTADGRWLAAAGADKSVGLWNMSRPDQRIRLEPSPQHAEQVNALIAWPNSRLIASGSDDTTIRLWGLDEKKLIATLSAEQGTTDWVAYTPDGLFDSSLAGEKQLTWLDNRQVLSLEQVSDRFHVYKLTDSLRRGEPPQAPKPPRSDPPRLSIDLPQRPVERQRNAALTISLGEPRLTNLRLYHNGVPVEAGPDFALQPDQRRFSTTVRLRSGLNRFYVMAGRPDATDTEGRSETVEVRYDGPDSPGQLHVLALGVSRYDRPGHSLQFADRDARQLAEFLHATSLRTETTPGLRIILADTDVTESKVNEAFHQIRDRVKGRPEDTVVVFLAGHADTMNGRYYLLLPSFPFPTSAPSDLRRGRFVDPLALNSRTVLAYAALHRNMARLNALQRLMVIDACQAEAIGDDPGVRQIEQMIDAGAQRARTAYLLAARRGEPAAESSALEHGLMTYALLKGMGAPNLEAVPLLSIFNDHPSADRDKDGVITTQELCWYTDLIVPKLAANFPLVVQRTGADGQPLEFRPTANLDQRPQIQAAGASFPLIELHPARIEAP